MPPEKPPVFQKLIDKFSNSRDFTISLVLHVILIAIFGTTVLFQAVKEPPDFECGTPNKFTSSEVQAKPPPQQTSAPVPDKPNITVPSTTTPVRAISVDTPAPGNFTMPKVIASPVIPAIQKAEISTPNPPGFGPARLTKAQADDIHKFTRDWVDKGRDNGTGPRNWKINFTAYVGQYADGNWNATVQIANNVIWNGSLPNLLYYMSSRSKSNITTNYKNVKAIKLDSDEIFAVRPPFIFLTGTRDFTLTDKEVENLQKYIRLGGAIWGDSSVPGMNSRFDIAFRREMKRVLPDVDKEWEILPAKHPIYTDTYYPDVREVPPGLNFYREPIYALKFCGEVAIIYTANDYGDMWQIGLTDQGQIDTRRNINNQYVAINEWLLQNSATYMRNISPGSLDATYKFGTNVVFHLLTRWESKIRTAAPL